MCIHILQPPGFRDGIWFLCCNAMMALRCRTLSYQVSPPYRGWSLSFCQRGMPSTEHKRLGAALPLQLVRLTLSSSLCTLVHALPAALAPSSTYLSLFGGLLHLSTTCVCCLSDSLTITLKSKLPLKWTNVPKTLAPLILWLFNELHGKTILN